MYQLEPDLTAEEKALALAPNSRRNLNWGDDLKKLGLEWDPSDAITRRMNVAILARKDYYSFNQQLPHSGGLRDQPVNWLRPMRAILQAEQDAENEKRVQEAIKKKNSQQ